MNPDDAPTPKGGTVVPEAEARKSILYFLDSLFAGAVAFSFAYTVHDYRDVFRGFWGHPYETLRDAVFQLVPTLIAVVFVLDDWINARPILIRYGYQIHNRRATTRLWLDVTILILAFFLLMFSPIESYAVVYLLLFGLICFCGYFWARLFDETTRTADQDIAAICHSHLATAIILISLAVVFGASDVVLRSRHPDARQDVRDLARWVSMIAAIGVLVGYKLILWYRKRRLMAV